MAKVIQVIETVEHRGRGVEGDPHRGVTQYWSLDGSLLAEVDPCATVGGNKCNGGAGGYSVAPGGLR